MNFRTAAVRLLCERGGTRLCRFDAHLFEVFPPSRLRFRTSSKRYDVVWTARRTGKWLVHHHSPHHTANDNVEVHEGGGLIVILEVTG